MMSATDVMPHAKLKMSISLTAQVFFISSQAVALHLCLAVAFDWYLLIINRRQC
jgi:hypothetical protein